jgi:malonyl-CoA/methylmalonyl-CoA synthetase
VVGVPDEKWGEKIVAAVVVKPGSCVNVDDIQAMCKKHLHDWKCPKTVNLVAELPRNTMGKVLKEDVKKLF